MILFESHTGSKVTRNRRLLSTTFLLFSFLISYPPGAPLRYKAVVEIRKLRQQLTNELNNINPSYNLVLDPNMPPPTEEEVSEG